MEFLTSGASLLSYLKKIVDYSVLTAGSVGIRTLWLSSCLMWYIIRLFYTTLLERKQFSHENKVFLKDLLFENKEKLEPKKTDGVSFREKQEVWEKITEMYNAETGVNWILGRLRLGDIISNKRKRIAALFWDLGLGLAATPACLGSFENGTRWLLVWTWGRWEAELLGPPVPSAPALRLRHTHGMVVGFRLLALFSSKSSLRSFRYLQHFFFTLFIIAIYPTGYIEFALGVSALVQLVDSLTVFTWLVAIFSLSPRSSSPLNITSLLIKIHTFVWGVMYMYLMPVYVLKWLGGETIRRWSSGERPPFLLLPLVLLAAHCLCALLSGTEEWNELRGERGAVSQREGDTTPIQEEDDEHTPLAEELQDYPLPVDELQGYPLPAQTAAMLTTSRRAKSKENLRLLYHTLKCMIMIKRKVAKMRKEKEEPLSNLDKEEEEERRGVEKRAEDVLGELEEDPTLSHNDHG